MNLNESRDTFYAVLLAAGKDLAAFGMSDQLDCSKERPWIRRGRYRAFFALVEAVTFSTKRLILEGYEAKLFELTAAEQMILLEKAYDLHDSGKIREFCRYPALKSNLRFTFDLFNKVYKTSFQIPYDHAGWQAIQIAIEIRDRVTHPKHAQDFDICDLEMRLLKRADAWFKRLCSEVRKVLDRPDFYKPKARL